MRLTILTLGSRGDVQPYVALARGFREAGHRVRLATHAEFRPFAEAEGVDFACLEGDPRGILATPEGQELMASGGNPFVLLRQFVRLIEPLAVKSVRDGYAACQDADAIIFSMTACFGSWIAERLRIPSCAAYCLPLTPTRAFTSTAFPDLPAWFPWGKGLYCRLTFLLGGLLLGEPLREAVNKARQEVLGMPPLPFGDVPWRSFPPGHPYLYGYSPTVLPKPADWDGAKHVTGYWFLDHAKTFRPPAGLLDFLDAGPPPVYVGFGSMNTNDSDEATNLIADALRRAGQRGVLTTGWGGLKPTGISDDVYHLESAPHDWLFPRMAAVVHHGGAGTTAAGLRAGVPSVIVPFMSDQPFWARRVLELGAGPPPIPRKRLTAERLAEAIRTAVTDQDLQSRARDLGARIQEEDGVGQAVEAFHRHLGVKRRAPRPAPALPRRPSLAPTPF